MYAPSRSSRSSWTPVWLAASALFLTLISTSSATAGTTNSVWSGSKVTVTPNRVQGGGLSIRTPQSWAAVSIDDPKLAQGLAAAAKVNPQFAGLSAQSMRAAGVVFLATDRNSTKAKFSDNVNGQVISPAPPSLKGAEAELKAALVGQGAVVQTQTRTTIGGLDANRTEYTLKVKALSGSEITVRGTQAVTVKNGKIYIVTISLSSVDAQLVNTMLASVRLV